MGGETGEERARGEGKRGGFSLCMKVLGFGDVQVAAGGEASEVEGEREREARQKYGTSSRPKRCQVLERSEVIGHGGTSERIKHRRTSGYDSA